MSDDRRPPAEWAVPLASTPERVTAPWLTEALRAAGAVTQSAVVERRVEQCGTGQLGDCYRFHLRYDRPEDGAPATLVRKFPSTDPVSRAYAAQVGLYAREVHF